MNKDTKKIVLSGMQPTGDLHIGNYLGALKNWVELQKKYKCFFFVADYHSITVAYDPKEKKNQILDLVLDYLAAGVDPEKSTIFIQSQIPECTELAWIFNSLTPIGELERMTQYKDKAQKNIKNINTGLLTYPILQAADILLYHANLVPVGQDQTQHLELAKDAARWFNNRFKVNYFEEPAGYLTETAKIMSLIEPEKKMSKSDGEKTYISIHDEPETILNKIKKAPTGTGDEKELPAGGKNLLNLLTYFGKEEVIKHFKTQVATHNVKYGEMKTAVAKAIADYLAPFRARRAELQKNKKYVEEILADGRQTAQKIAQKTIGEVKEIIGLL
ncbi:MAG: tryptophan--tRNA ligase [Patescibacteria group bacterium]|nr:tryptophan--tRNA ligase [Patescibacteria group bacterium]MDD5490984.1 tryptophan--tRNA ligase [Patescibacteria group bacterium]